ASVLSLTVIHLLRVAVLQEASHLVQYSHVFPSSMLCTDIKMSVGVSTAALVSLPRTRKWVTLYLTDMSDIDVSHACEVFQKLQPPGGYRNIICEFSKLTMEGIQDVIHGLADHSVTVKQWLTVTTTVTINEEQHEQLCNMATETLACDFLINAS
ncbi:hypothetical protein OTU49_002993, partial [Cherax quadricarinatus]